MSAWLWLYLSRGWFNPCMELLTSLWSPENSWWGVDYLCVYYEAKPHIFACEGALKSRDLTTADLTTRHQISWVDNASCGASNHWPGPNQKYDKYSRATLYSTHSLLRSTGDLHTCELTGTDGQTDVFSTCWNQLIHGRPSWCFQSPVSSTVGGVSVKVKSLVHKCSACESRLFLGNQRIYDLRWTGASQRWEKAKW